MEKVLQTANITFLLSWFICLFTCSRKCCLHKYNLFDYNTKQDLEDLPTTWDGYDIFPFRSKFFASDGKQIVAMSGKFHSAWGEFGGFKHRDAILYEVASMVAFGANVNIGDQLHPSGLMDMDTYKNIGYAFIPIGYSKEGTEFTIKSPYTNLEAKVVPMPFYDPKKKIPIK